MPTFDLPEDLAEFLEERAKRLRKKNAQDLLVAIVDDLRTKDRQARKITNVAPKSYLKKK